MLFSNFFSQGIYQTLTAPYFVNPSMLQWSSYLLIISENLFETKVWGLQQTESYKLFIYQSLNGAPRILQHVILINNVLKTITSSRNHLPSSSSHSIVFFSVWRLTGPKYLDTPFWDSVYWYCQVNDFMSFISTF